MVVQGDSGGPLTVVDSSERHTLVGLVSKRLIENQCNKVKHIISTALVVSTPSPVDSKPMHCNGPYLIFVIFFTRAKFLENKITPKNANFSR